MADPVDAPRTATAVTGMASAATGTAGSEGTAATEGATTEAGAAATTRCLEGATAREIGGSGMLPHPLR